MVIENYLLGTAEYLPSLKSSLPSVASAGNQFLSEFFTCYVYVEYGFKATLILKKKINQSRDHSVTVSCYPPA